LKRHHSLYKGASCFYSHPAVAGQFTGNT